MMVHSFKSKGWVRSVLNDGTLRFVQDDKVIDVHKSMGMYWVDYTKRGSHVIGTLKPAKTMTEAMKHVNEAKDEFELKEKR